MNSFALDNKRSSINNGTAQNNIKIGTTMSKVFQVRPKRIKRSNGTVLTPEMVVTVTTQIEFHIE